MDYAEEQVRQGGYSTIWLTTPEDHPYLPRMYRERGYEEIGTDTQEYHEFEFIRMEKELR